MTDIFAPPPAAALTEALRGLGYTPGTAIADIIDNSISADATTVDIEVCVSDTDAFLTISDNGKGMSASGLQKAMMLGNRNPKDERAPGDLGRFGLGLKTASFSQCRRLTVASKQAGTSTVLRWDLDDLANRSDGGWYILSGAHPGSECRLKPLDSQSSGTLVLWELPDRLLPGKSVQEALDIQDKVAAHLAMVFHRYLSTGRLRITLNNIKVAAWDPFLSMNSFTWNSPKVRLGSGRNAAVAQAHVLPHKDRLKPSEFEAAEGPDGWTAQQGFYVYRNDRLLVAGSWLGLGRGKGWTKDEALKLARISVDISNAADADWKIDIRKSTASPPAAIVKPLTALAEDARERARRVFAFRGRNVDGRRETQTAAAWKAVQSRKGTRYAIDMEHPVIASIVAAIKERDHQLALELKAAFRVIEESVPVQRIWLDTAEAKDTPLTAFAGTPSDEIAQVATTIYQGFLNRRGLTPSAAKALMRSMEPFDQFPELIDSLT